MSASDLPDTSDDTIVPIQEEVARVEKRRSVTGRVRVHTSVEHVEQLVDAELAGEELEITRVPVGQVVTEIPKVRVEGDLTIVPVLEEVLKVEKQLVLAEELHIRRNTVTESVELPVVLKKQRAVVERE
jgi:uncharacterized protein (TIGR02271 family)